MDWQRLLGGTPRVRYGVPDGMRVYAVGDVHGRADLLRPMLRWIREDSEARGGVRDVHVVFLGDLIDRGRESAMVLDMLSGGEGAFGRRHFVRGNHDHALQSILEGDGAAIDDWLEYGGGATLNSYGLDPVDFWRDPSAFHARVIDRIPDAHRSFLRAMTDWVRLGDYLFVHAGVRPGVALQDQTARDLRSIRGDFLRSRKDHGMMVVHGHTVSTEVDIRANRIGLDTGAFATDHLSVLGLEGTSRWVMTSRTRPRCAGSQASAAAPAGRRTRSRAA